MAEKPESAAIYARISDDTEGRAAGVGRQTEDAQALAERLGWGMAPLPPFVDNDISASTRSKARRPAFEDLIARVEAGEIDGIVYYSSSRLTRRPAEFESIIQLVERTGVRLASVASGNADLTTADGRMIARILAAQDAAEAERTGERVKRAFQQRRDEGKPNPSSRAFGFEKGGLAVNEEEATLIREAANLILSEGWSLGQVVAEWNRRDIPRVRGAGKWNRTQVKRALTNPRVAGLVTQGGKVVGTTTVYEPIISPDEQERIQAALTGRRHGQTVTFGQRKNVLAGFLVCGRCGKPMKVNALLEEDGSYRADSYVVCSRSQYGCGGVKRNLPVLTQYLDGLVRMRIEGWQPVADVGLDEEIEEVTILQRRLMEIEEDLASLQMAFNTGTIRFADYNTALAALRTQQEAAQRAVETFQGFTPMPEDLDLLAAWEVGEVEERREVLSILIDHIKLMPVGKVGPVRMREMMPLTTEVVWR